MVTKVGTIQKSGNKASSVVKISLHTILNSTCMVATGWPNQSKYCCLITTLLDLLKYHAFYISCFHLQEMFLVKLRWHLQWEWCREFKRPCLSPLLVPGGLAICSGRLKSPPSPYPPPPKKNSMSIRWNKPHIFLCMLVFYHSVPLPLLPFYCSCICSPNMSSFVRFSC